MGNSTLFSIITPVFNTDPHILNETILSVINQTVPNWELILVDDASTNMKTVHVLESWKLNPKIRIITHGHNSGIVNASNTGLAAAQGNFLVLLDHDDILHDKALEVVDEVIRQNPEADLIYSDEDKIDLLGNHFDEFKKPNWSPERLRGQMYLGHLLIFSSVLLKRAGGGFRTQFEGSQDHELALRLSECANQIIHVSETLYSWRTVEGSTATDNSNKPYAWDAGLKAVQAHVDRVGISAEVEKGQVPGTYLVNRLPNLADSISVIIPTRLSSGKVRGEMHILLQNALESIADSHDAQNLEFIIVLDGDVNQKQLNKLEIPNKLKVSFCVVEGEFNFSKKCNVGAIKSSGKYLVFLNDDVQALGINALSRLVAPLAEPKVGLVGPLLLFEDDTIQHAGLGFIGSDIVHCYSGSTLSEFGTFSELLINHECDALTAACVGISRSNFFELGGFSEELPVNFNDVDLSLKASSAGLRNVWMRDVQLYHFESKTRVPHVSSYEHQTILRKWKHHFSGNPQVRSQ